MVDSLVLSAWAFPGVPDAQRAARRLAALSGPPVDDVAVVSWPEDQRRPAAWQARELSADQRLSGAFWGLLFAQLFLLPLSLKSPPALPLDDSDDALRCLGVDADFLRTVRDRVVPGTSALFLLDSADLQALLGDQLPPGAVELAERRLSPEQSTRLHAGFADDGAYS